MRTTMAPGSKKIELDNELKNFPNTDESEAAAFKSSSPQYSVRRPRVHKDFRHYFAENDHESRSLCNEMEENNGLVHSETIRLRWDLIRQQGRNADRLLVSEFNGACYLAVASSCPSSQVISLLLGLPTIPGPMTVCTQ
jgi:hypothetical protein